jgi:hypothetical protein
MAREATFVGISLLFSAVQHLTYVPYDQGCANTGL